MSIAATSEPSGRWRELVDTKEWSKWFVRPRKVVKPHKFFAFDCEGDAESFKLAAFQWRDKAGRLCWVVCRSREAAVERLELLGNAGYVGYAHNLAYDLGVLFEQPWGADLGVKLMGEAVLEARWKGHALYDSMGLCPDKLSKIGASLGLPKLDMAVDPLDDYCLRDAEIVYRLVEGVQEWATFHGCRYSHRLGSLVVNYASRHTDEPWARCSDEAAVYGERAMYPGRAEAFRTEALEHVRTYDVNSMYPAMLAGRLPDPRSMVALSKPDWGYAGVYHVTVEVPEQELPPLPYRAADGAIYYPTGTWDGWYTTAELVSMVGWDAGRVAQFHEGVAFPREVQPFRTLVGGLYAERQVARAAGNGAQALICKLLLNSLWGRLGMNPGQVREIKPRSVYHPSPCGHCHGCRSGVTCDRLRGIELAGRHWVVPRYSGAPPDYLNHLWAAWVASLARVKLYGLLQECWSGSVVRCHTDSLTVDNSALYPSGLSRFVGPELGCLKVEHDGPAQFRTANAYRYGNEVHVAGVPSELAAGYWDSGHAEVERPYSLLEGLASGQVSRWHRVPLLMMDDVRPARHPSGRAWRVEELG